MTKSIIDQLNREGFFSFKIISPPEIHDLAAGKEKIAAGSTLILCSNDQGQSQQTAFLEKILQAVQVELGKQAFLIRLTASEKISSSSYLEVPAISKILVFGLPPEQIGLQIEVTPYELFHFCDRQMLFADSLADISSKKSLKRLLWEALKVLFPNEK
jgi:hypothetical protein